MQCQNNLKQIGLALHNYHGTLNEFPTNSVMQRPGAYYFRLGNNTNQYGRLSYIVAILPYMEQISMYEACMITQVSVAGETHYDASGIQIFGNPAAARAADDVWYRQIPTLRCPSDPGGMSSSHSPTGGTQDVGRNNYLASSGDWPEAHVFRARADNYQRLGEYIANPRGAFSMRTVYREGQPDSGNIAAKTMAAIRDGTSNTIAVAEKCIGDLGTGANPLPTGLRIKRAIATGHGDISVAGGHGDIYVSPTTAGIPNRCLTGTTSGRVYMVHANGDSGGVRWGDGIAIFSSFSTILPPNAPSCTASNDEVLDRLLSTASSEHPGGVNVLRFDGSAMLVTDTISTNSGVQGAGITSTSTGLDRFAVASGPSPYGVWGALGSINGGEAVSAP
jgi:prepilin-type processing-associated H-X9-DG protein